MAEFFLLSWSLWNLFVCLPPWWQQDCYGLIDLSLSSLFLPDTCACECVCVLFGVCVCFAVCACVCVRERERESQNASGYEPVLFCCLHETQTNGVCVLKRYKCCACVCVCACVRAGEGERETEYLKQQGSDGCFCVCSEMSEYGLRINRWTEYEKQNEPSALQKTTFFDDDVFDDDVRVDNFSSGSLSREREKNFKGNCS